LKVFVIILQILEKILLRCNNRPLLINDFVILSSDKNLIKNKIANLNYLEDLPEIKVSFIIE